MAICLRFGGGSVRAICYSAGTRSLREVAFEVRIEGDVIRGHIHERQFFSQRYGTYRFAAHHALSLRARHMGSAILRLQRFPRGFDHTLSDRPADKAGQPIRIGMVEFPQSA